MKWSLSDAAPLAAVLLAAAALVGCGDRSSPAPSPPTGAKKTPSALSALCEQRFGKADAKVQVIAILPVSVGCQDAVGLYVIDLARKYPEFLCAQVLDMKSDAGRRAFAQYQVKCASVLVNGKTTFDLGGDNGKVLLEGPTGAHYSLDDLRRVLQAAVTAAAGPDAPQLPPAPADETPSTDGR